MGQLVFSESTNAAALEYAKRNADEKKLKGPRYEFTHVWTDGEHNDRHPGAILPEASRWLWKTEKGDK